MNINIEEHILPRPVDRLPDYAHAKSRSTLAEKLVEAFGLSDEASTAIASAVVDPSAVRKSIGDPLSPNVEEIRVPGGTLLGIRTEAWSRKLMPDPRNPRIGPARRHPFAVDPGTSGEDSRFRPVREPRAFDDDPLKAQLIVDVESHHHLTWASLQASRYVLAENDWRKSIASQGVMEHVWVVATTYQYADGTPPVTVAVSAEGSSRMTAVHNLLEVRSADIPCEDNDARLRAHLKKLNEAFLRGADPQQAVHLRCERVPALFIVGFREHGDSGTTFPTAVRSLVALRHVDPPKPWGAGPENEALADEVLDELARRGLISETQKAYYAGSCTRTEAVAAHLSDDPAIRAAEIVRLFTSTDPEIAYAIRVAVTSQSTRKRISTKLCDELATALILRAMAEDRDKTDQVRRYLKEAYGKASHRERWEATNRLGPSLVDAAIQDLNRWFADGQAGDPGPSALELAVRAAYPLVSSGALNADRGTANNEQPDRRTPGEVLDAMRRSFQGVQQLGRALLDQANESPIRRVDEQGNVQSSEEGAPLYVNDIYLRCEYPAQGKARPAKSDDTPEDRLQNRVHEFGNAVEHLSRAFEAVQAVQGLDGLSLVESVGVSSDLCASWQEKLRDVEQELAFWDRTFRKRHGQPTAKTVSALVEDEFDDERDGVFDEEAAII